MPTIGFIGGGNMAASLIGGLLKAGYPATDIIVADPDESQQQRLQSAFSVNVTGTNNNVLGRDILVLAVKPQLLNTVCRELDQEKLANTLVISIAAGVRSTDINRWLHNNGDCTQPIVRCMPNTPALLQCGASGLYANNKVSSEQKQQAETILQAVGIVIWVEREEQLDAVTAVSGSGPAYFFLMMEAMQETAIKLGLDTASARKLVLQTALGAARMATESEADPGQLRKQVTSKGGTTEQAIASFQNAGFKDMVNEALTAASLRSVSLAEELGSE